MIKYLKYGDGAKEALAAGVDKLADTVGCTMGASGRNVIVQRKIHQPLIINDGVTIIRDITLKDNFENIGAQLLKKAAFHTNYSVGDGSSVCVLLSQKMIHSGMKRLSVGDISSFIQQGMDKAQVEVCAYLKEHAHTVQDTEDIARVAAIASGDESIGRLVSEVIGRVGPKGVIMVESGHLEHHTVEYSEGMRVDSGFYPGDIIRPDNGEQRSKEEMTLIEPLILCVSSAFKDISSLIPILTEAMRINRPLLLFAEDFKEKAIGDLLRASAQEASFFVVPIKAPGYGPVKKGMLEDIAVLTGGKLVSAASGVMLNDVSQDMFGTAKRVILTEKRTVIIGGAGENGLIKDHIESLKTQRQQTNDEYICERLQSRIDELSGGNAVIYAGATTEMEMKNFKLRIDNAVNAAYAALEEGVIPGGGTALLRAREHLDEIIESSDKLFTAGMQVVRDSLDAPIKQIVSNAGYNSTSVIKEILKDNNCDIGFDVVRGCCVNMMEVGLLDTVKTIRVALQNAINTAATVLTAGCVIGLDPKYVKNDPRKNVHPDDYMDI